MREIPNDLSGGDSMTNPVMKAARAPEGDSERLRNPCPANNVATRVGTNWMSDTLKVIMVEDCGDQ